MAKGLMDENQQPSVTQELERLFCSTRSRGRRGEIRELLGVGAGESSASATDTNNTSVATWSPTKRKKYVDQKQHQRNYGSLYHIKQSQEKLLVNLLSFFHAKFSD